MPKTDNISAITGIATPIGDYRGPERNCAPNPGGYWSGSVKTKYGWKHVQKRGKEATWKAMKRLGAIE
jgi:hypothetical protein